VPKDLCMVWVWLCGLFFGLQDLSWFLVSYGILVKLHTNIHTHKYIGRHIDR